MKWKSMRPVFGSTVPWTAPGVPAISVGALMDVPPPLNVMLVPSLMLIVTTPGRANPSHPGGPACAGRALAKKPAAIATAAATAVSRGIMASTLCLRISPKNRVFPYICRPLAIGRLADLPLVVAELQVETAGGPGLRRIRHERRHVGLCMVVVDDDLVDAGDDRILLGRSDAGMGVGPRAVVVVDVAVAGGAAGDAAQGGQITFLYGDVEVLDGGADHLLLGRLVI